MEKNEFTKEDAKEILHEMVDVMEQCYKMMDDIHTMENKLRITQGNCAYVLNILEKEHLKEIDERFGTENILCQGWHADENSYVSKVWNEKENCKHAFRTEMTKLKNGKGLDS